MAYNQKAKFKANSPLPCWKGYERVPGTKKGAPGSCRKRSPNKHGSLEDFQKGIKGHNPDTMSAKHEDFHLKQSGESPVKEYVSDAQRKAVWASKADGGAGNPNKMKSPIEKQKGGGTRKTCLPIAKIRSMSKSARKRLVNAKQKAGKAGKYRRSSKTNVKGARKKGAKLRDWFRKEDWRQVNNPKKKCGEK